MCSSDLLEYLKNILNNEGKDTATDIRICLPFIPMNSLIKINGYLYYLGGKTGEQIYIYNAQQLKMKKEEVEYIRKIEKAVSLSKFDEIDREKNPVLTKERNIDLYEKIQKKIEKTVYKHRLTSIENSLIDGKQKFVNLDFEKQCKILNSILYNLTKTFKADLRDIGGSENSGGCLCSKNINNYKEFKLIQQSITGLYSCEKDLMTI